MNRMNLAFAIGFGFFSLFPSINSQNKQGEIGLIETIKYKPGLVPGLLQKGALPDLPDTPLVDAILRQDIQTVALLLKDGANPDGIINGQKRIKTPLMYALDVLSKDSIELLLDNGANINVRIDGNTILSIARRRSQFGDDLELKRLFAAIIGLLVAHGATE